MFRLQRSYTSFDNTRFNIEIVYAEKIQVVFFNNRETMRLGTRHRDSFALQERIRALQNF